VRVLRRALLDGALVILPAGAIVLLVLGIIARLRDAADPLFGQFVHPVVGAVGLLILLCLLVGLLLRSAFGATLRRSVEHAVLDKVPGYRLVKAFLGDGPAAGSSRALRPALAITDDGECPALVMDELADGRLVVFVPGAPAPMSGAIFLFAPDRVRLLDVPLVAFMKAISSWGIGLAEVLEQAEAASQAAQARKTG
jgi:uncharacterized membrane protein